MKIIKNYLYNVFYQVFVLLVPFITIPYLARILGPTGVGINSYTNSIIQIFILVGGLGTNLYGSRQVAFVREDKKNLTKTFYEISLLRLLIFIGVFIIFILFVTINTKYKAYYWAQSISILAAMLDIAWFFMGIENFAITVIRNIFVKVMTLVLIFTFVKNSADLLTYILIVSLSLVIGNLMLFPDIKKYIYKPDFTNIDIWKHFFPSVVLFIPQIATQIYVILNKVLLGSMNNVQVAGFFDQSDKIVKMVLAIVTATGTVMMPHVANAFAKGEHNKTRDYLYTSFSFVSAIAIPMMFGLISVANKFVPLFFTNKFISVIPIMMVESIVILFIAWSNAIGTQYLFPTNQTKLYTKSIVLGIIVNLVADVPLIYFFSAIGASIATVLSELSVTIYQLNSIKNQINYNKLFFDNSKYLIAGSVMFIVTFVLDRILSNSWNMLFFEVIIAIIIYVLMLIILKAEIISSAYDLWNKISIKK